MHFMVKICNPHEVSLKMYGIPRFRQYSQLTVWGIISPCGEFYTTLSHVPFKLHTPYMRRVYFFDFIVS